MHRFAPPLAFVLALLLAVPGAVRAAPVTRYLAPLQQHAAALSEVGADITQLASAPKPASQAEARALADRITRAGNRLLAEGRAFRSTVRQFIAGDTRRGLDVEIEIIHATTESVNQMAAEYRGLPGVTAQRAAARNRSEIRKFASTWAAVQLDRRLSGRLREEGVADVLVADSWNEARQRVVAHGRSLLNDTIDRETERVLGLRFHDGRSARRAVILRVNTAMERQVEKLLVGLTSSSLIIEIGAAVIVRWVKDLFWNRILPRVKELFRGKGNLTERTARSVESMRRARNRLMALPGDARLRDVVAEARRANEAIAATHFLVSDLTRAGRQADVARLNEAAGELAHARDFTLKRFLLHKEPAIERVSADESVLAEVLDELPAMVASVRPVGAASAGPVNISGRWSPGDANVATISGSGTTYHWTATNGQYKHEGTLTGDGRRFEGAMKDVPGWCCGREGYIWLEIVDRNTIRVRSRWWFPGKGSRENPELNYDWAVFRRMSP